MCILRDESLLKMEKNNLYIFSVNMNKNIQHVKITPAHDVSTSYERLSLKYL